MTLEKIPIKIRATGMMGIRVATSAAATGATQTNRHAHNRAGNLVDIRAAATKAVEVDTKAKVAAAGTAAKAAVVAAAAADTKAVVNRVAMAAAVRAVVSRAGTNNAINANRVVDTNNKAEAADINKVAAEGSAAVDLIPEADMAADAPKKAEADISKVARVVDTNSKAEAVALAAIGVTIAGMDDAMIVTADKMNG